MKRTKNELKQIITVGALFDGQLCQDEQVPNFSLNNALQFYRLAQKKGHGKDDSSSVIRTIREMYRSV